MSIEFSSDASKHHSGTRVLAFDLHPLYSAILRDGMTVREGEVLGLDGDLRRALIAPYSGTVRMLVTGQGEARRVKVYLTEHSAPARRSAQIPLHHVSYRETSRN